jgi:hypothetical protein
MLTLLKWGSAANTACPVTRKAVPLVLDQLTAPAYGVFACKACQDEPQDECGDACAVDWADDLPPLWAETSGGPICRCCGRPAHLVAPLLAVV